MKAIKLFYGPMSCVNNDKANHRAGVLTESISAMDNVTMIRVLLLVDDYRELVFLQTLLKKTGFDVDGSQNGKKYEELKLTLNPELIIASSKGKSINGLKMAEELKRHNTIPKFILIVPHKMAQKVHGLKLKNVDGIIDSPIEAKKLLVTMARVCSLDSDTLIEKYNKMIQNLDADNDVDLQLLKMDKVESNDETIRVSAPFSVDPMASPPSIKGNGKVRLNPSTISDEDRVQRMQSAIDELETPEVDGFSQEVVHQWNRKIRSEENEVDLKDLEDERQLFVKNLFKKPSS